MNRVNFSRNKDSKVVTEVEIMSLGRVPEHTRAVLQAVFIVFLWATSWVLIKVGLGAIPALTFAGLRYGLAFLILAGVALRPARLAAMRALPRGVWFRLCSLGVLLYALTQGAMFVSLSLLPAITTNLLWSFTTVASALLGMLVLGERPGAIQWAGLAVYLGGVALYFTPVELPAGQVGGVIAAAVGVLANAGATVLGREVNRSGALDPLVVTLISMGVGGALLLASGSAVQGLPSLGWQDWLIVGWLAAVNTALAFTLWNHTLRILTAMESSVINSLMLVFIPLLAWLFLGEGVSLREAAALIAAGVGILVVQLRRTPPAAESD